ncbi:MAG TPA: DinB family protein [Anseongella sp.]|nr:DinB family protein [Anseongella sp.]
MDALNYLAGEFSNVYNGSPWYGKPVCEVLKGIQPAAAFARPAEKVHSIAELLAHMISWRQVLINSLEKNGKPKPKQHETFMTGTYGDNEETMWQKMKETFDRQHQQITKLLSAATAAGKGGTLRLINGVIQHDIYHLGQIAMLKKELT